MIVSAEEYRNLADALGDACSSIHSCVVSIERVRGVASLVRRVAELKDTTTKRKTNSEDAAFAGRVIAKAESLITRYSL